MFFQHNLIMMKFAGFSRFAFDLKAAERGVVGGAYLQWLATALAAAYLLGVLYVNLSVVLADVGQSPAEFAAPASTETAVQNPPMDLPEIGTWHLFGQSPESVSGKGAVAETQLQLKLLGIMFLSKDPENASGIIQADDGQQKKYRLGDQLPGGAVLQAVEADRVLLKHGERQESLLLKKDSVRAPSAAE
jgi:type II secretory pathway component PulC